MPDLGFLRSSEQSVLRIAFALTSDGDITGPDNAQKGGEYRCPGCRTIVILKKGLIKCAHFAHRADTRCTFESYEHAASKKLIEQVVNDSTAGRGPRPLLHRKCDQCRDTWQEPLPSFVYWASPKERYTEDGSRLDVPLLDDDLVSLVAGVEILKTHAVGLEKKIRLCVPFVEVRACEILSDPFNWYLVQDTFPKPCCKNCERIAADEAKRAAAAAERKATEAAARAEQEKRNAEAAEKFRVARATLLAEQEAIQERRRDEMRSRLSPDQLAAVTAIQGSTRNRTLCFVTGPAGSGKSFVIDFLRGPGVVVCASTAAAAELVGGGTLDSYIMKIPRIRPPHQKLHPKAMDRISQTKMVIIDECSMIGRDHLELLYQRFRECRVTPKVVLVGDLLQLHPVESQPIYDDPYFRLYTRYNLTTMHRQTDRKYIDVLGDIRIGDWSRRALELIESRRVAELPLNCPQIYAHRYRVEAVNRERLSALPGPEEPYPWEETYWVGSMHPEKDLKSERAAAEGNARYHKHLHLRIGARVCLLNNDRERRWCNGSMGTLVSFADSMGELGVELDSGKRIHVGRDEDFIYDEYGGLQLVVKQYPVALAWAMTVHRAQGRTLDRVGIDLSNHFGFGMTYTALSRCRAPSGLYFIGSRSRLRIDPRALAICG